MSSKTFVVVVLAVAGALASCKTAPEPAEDVVPQYSDELQVEDLVVGTGPVAESGLMVTVNYTGWLTTGQTFDSSIGKDPFRFELGEGRVIKGWDQGVVGMKVGGKRKLTIPPRLAYGSRAVGPIPANSPLIFEVELLDVAR